MQVGKACKREVVTIKKSESVVQAARRMREYHVGDLVVVGDRDVPVGVLTDRDLVVGVLAKEAEHISTRTVGDVLIDRPFVVQADDDVRDVLQRMEKEGVRRAPVVDAAGVVAGILTLDDILALLAEDMATVVSLVRRQPQREQERRW